MNEGSLGASGPTGGLPARATAWYIPHPQAGGVAPGYVMREEHEVPEWLGDYKLRKLIARGGMGEVWLAAKHGTGKPCVVKVLRRELSRDPDYRRRFFREADILERLNHGHIVPIIHFGEERGWLFIVMAYVDGLDLGRFCRAIFEHGEVVPVEVVGYIAGGVLAGLRHAHERAPGGRPLHIIHSDVTPGNVLISSEGEVFVTDFGVARQLGDVSADVFGTFDYMAPEQWEGEPCVQSDLYGLGGLLLFMLTGRPPRRVKTPLEMQANLRPVIGDLGRDDVPEPLERLLRLCLEPDRTKRLRSAREGILLLGSWNGYAEQAIVTAALYQRHVGPQHTGLTGILRSAPRRQADATNDHADQPSHDAGGVGAGGTLRAEPSVPPSVGAPAHAAQTGRVRTEVLNPPMQAPMGPPPEPVGMVAPDRFVTGGTVRVESVESPPRPASGNAEPKNPDATVLLVPPSGSPAHDELRSSLASPEPANTAEPESGPPALLWLPWWGETQGDDPEDGVTMHFVPPRHPRPRSLPPAHLAEPDAPRLFRRPHRLAPTVSGEASAPPTRPETERMPPPEGPLPSRGAPPADAALPERTGDPLANPAPRPDTREPPSTKSLTLGLLVTGALAVASGAGPRASHTRAGANVERRAASSMQAGIPSRLAARDLSTGATQ